MYKTLDVIVILLFLALFCVGNSFGELHMVQVFRFCPRLSRTHFVGWILHALYRYEKSFMHRDVVTHVAVSIAGFFITGSLDGMLCYKYIIMYTRTHTHIYVEREERERREILSAII